MALKDQRFREWFYPVVLRIEYNNTKHLQKYMSYGVHNRIEIIPREHPEWLMRIPLRILASYIGTSNTTIELARDGAMERPENRETEQ